MRTIPITSGEGRSEDRREQSRHSVLFRTVLIDSEIEGEAAEIINIARLGFLARTSLQLEKESPVRLDMPVVGAVDATVVWCGNGLLGGRFVRPIDEASFSSLLHSLT